MSGPSDHPYGFAEIEATADTRLFRRCKKSHIKEGEIGFWLFANGLDGMMSVDAERCRPEADEVAVVAATHWGLVSFPESLAADLDQVLLYWPEDDNHAHTQVVGSKTQSTQKRLADGATFVLAPEID